MGKLAVLISIRPKWCELIASGKKTVEVRKTKPNAILPLKFYIYETQGNERAGNAEFTYVKKGRGRGKVIGEFICHNIYPVCAGYIHGSCLEYDEVINYLGNNGRGWGWAISDLVIYDSPKELNEFYRWCGWTFEVVERAPQSWMYVEELK